ncbi:MAG: 1-deoxy-D-xylulose-5-phosphate reductoisomerase, partial [Thermodesulfobacteriota bacterium]|nr:1-deoxy-D-xylulose-5-phosphate reductoisomerase [Thermodesulfobacteriota bacterium]
KKFPRTLVVLGSTGSIGVSALSVLTRHESDFRVLGLAGARNAELLAEQAAKWRPLFLAVLNSGVAKKLASLLPGDYTPEILIGSQGYVDMATLDEADMVLAAQVGAAGLPPTYAAAAAGKMIALANKEALVLAGDLIREACAKSGAVILPVDSEHNALFQAMAGHDTSDIRKLILTASGGPFRGKTLSELAKVTPAQALRHPNWSMGAKISIDSATLMNKGLEVIEAHHLFGFGPDAIQVVVHAQSIVHSLVEYVDGSMLAHLGPPDMQIAIAYALGYPKRLNPKLKPLDLVETGPLTFEAPALDIFPCLEYAFEALRSGPSYPVALNAANEAAVDLFLSGRIEFLKIPALIKKALDNHKAANVSSIKAVLDMIDETTARVREWV